MDDELAYATPINTRGASAQAAATASRRERQPQGLTARGHWVRPGVLVGPGFVVLTAAPGARHRNGA